MRARFWLAAVAACVIALLLLAVLHRLGPENRFVGTWDGHNLFARVRLTLNRDGTGRVVGGNTVEGRVADPGAAEIASWSVDPERNRISIIIGKGSGAPDLGGWYTWDGEELVIDHSRSLGTVRYSRLE